MYICTKNKKSLLLMFVAFLTLIFAQACVSAEKAELRILVRFTNEVTEPASERLVNSLSKTVNTELLYLKEISKRRNTHLYRTKSPVETSLYDQIIKVLSQRGDVVYAEKNIIYQLNNQETTK